MKARDGHIIVGGHAGYAEPGKDIVCSAVSVLIQTLVKSIQSLIGSIPVYALNTGAFIIETENLSEAAALLIDSFFIGICLIANEYPDYVRII
ncbi:ribosomal-processing cysteine protease Prp [Diplocloster modestus]|uniref:ribosomal-processing cysteine protease Prp n=1 Tax=Diplocloster modestus TaxID=2850322 RepID=UPI001EE99D61